MTSAEAHAFWTELERALKQIGALRQPPSWRRRRTGEMRVTITEKRAMQAFHLLYGESYTTLARRFNRDRHYVRRWIWDERYRDFFRYYWGADAEKVVTRGSRSIATDDDTGAAA